MPARARGREACIHGRGIVGRRERVPRRDAQVRGLGVREHFRQGAAAFGERHVDQRFRLACEQVEDDVAHRNLARELGIDRFALQPRLQKAERQDGPVTFGDQFAVERKRAGARAQRGDHFGERFRHIAQRSREE